MSRGAHILFGWSALDGARLEIERWAEAPRVDELRRVVSELHCAERVELMPAPRALTRVTDLCVDQGLEVASGSALEAYYEEETVFVLSDELGRGAA